LNKIEIHFSNITLIGAEEFDDFNNELCAIAMLEKSSQMIGGYQLNSYYGNLKNNIVIIGIAPMGTINCDQSAAILNCDTHFTANISLNNAQFNIFGITGYYVTLYHEFIHARQQKEASIALRKVKHINQPYTYGDPINSDYDWSTINKLSEDYINFVDLYFQSTRYTHIRCDLNKDGKYGVAINTGDVYPGYEFIQRNCFHQYIRWSHY